MSTLRPPIPTTKRYKTIDIAKGVAIILVVIGHFTARNTPAAFKTAVDVIYLFHMPLFMFASGFLYQATWRPTPYRHFLKKKFIRLMIPYFVVSVIIIIFKLLSANVLPLDHPITLATLFEILYLPAAGYFLWFIWALWWMMVIIPLFKTPAARKLLLLASVILFCVSDIFPEIFCLKQTADMLIFFTVGTLTADHLHTIRRIRTKLFIFGTLAFVIMAVAIETGMTRNTPFLASKSLSLLTNISGIIMSLAVAAMINHSKLHRFKSSILSIATFSYLIYLFHTTFEGLAKGVLSKAGLFNVTPPDIASWWIGAIISISAGVLIPYILGRYIFCRWKSTSILFGTPIGNPTNR